jgi:hypothetical protein
MFLLKISELPKHSKGALKPAKREKKEMNYSENLHTCTEDDVDR